MFDANNLGASLGGDRLTKLTLFADTPRALAVSADGKTVYAAAFFSGNMTTVVSTDSVRHVYAGLLDPSKSLIKWPGLPVYQPLTGLVVKGRPDGRAPSTGSTPTAPTSTPTSSVSCPTSTSSPSTPRADRGHVAANVVHAASARRCSTWRSTR